jgi:hypothetical protein
MSLDYGFEIETDLTKLQVLGIVAKIHNAEINSKDLGFRVIGASIGVSSKDYVSDWGRMKYVEGYGFFPSVVVDFTQVTIDGFELSQHNIAKSVAVLFKELQGKAVLTFNYDMTIAQRLEGNVIEVHEAGDESYPDYYDWLVNEFDKVGLNYVRKVLRSPLQE